MLVPPPQVTALVAGFRRRVQADSLGSEGRVIEHDYAEIEIAAEDDRQRLVNLRRGSRLRRRRGGLRRGAGQGQHRNRAGSRKKFLHFNIPTGSSLRLSELCGHPWHCH